MEGESRSYVVCLGSPSSVCPGSRVLWPSGSARWVFGKGLVYFGVDRERPRVTSLVGDLPGDEIPVELRKRLPFLDPNSFLIPIGAWVFRFSVVSYHIVLFLGLFLLGSFQRSYLVPWEQGRWCVVV